MERSPAPAADKADCEGQERDAHRAESGRGLGLAAAAALFAVFCFAMAYADPVHRARAGPANAPGVEAPRLLAQKQHIWVVRHGDKYSSYPPCPADGGPCMNEKVMGDNPPLTPCGVTQAEFTASWLQNESKSYGGIQHIAVSPFTRTLQTALPLARTLKLQLKVEYLLSEANQDQGPFRPFNILESELTESQLEEVSKLWDLHYGSPPIKTPENNTLYQKRVERAAKVLKDRLPPSSGNAVIYTHATTSFSVAYGLCHSDNSTTAILKAFVDGQDAIGPAGVIHVVLDGQGKCETIGQTNNVGMEVGCGETPPHKCNYSEFPSWYWANPVGQGPGRCS